MTLCMLKEFEVLGAELLELNQDKKTGTFSLDGRVYIGKVKQNKQGEYQIKYLYSKDDKPEDEQYLLERLNAALDEGSYCDMVYNRLFAKVGIAIGILGLILLMLNR